MSDPLADVADNIVALHAAKKKTARPRRLAYRFAGDTRAHLQGQYLVKGLFPVGLSAIFGRANAGKTAVALDLVLHMAAGLAYRERRTREALVVWLALEAPESLDNRVVAWCTHHRVALGDLLFASVRGTLDLRHKASIAELIEVLAEIEAHAGERITVLAIDTLARAMPGANENASEDMGAAIAALDRIRAELVGASILLLHHVGKDDTRGPRGHSSLLAAVDAGYEVKDGELIVHKARDAKIGDALAFELRGVPIGEDEDAETVTAVVAVAAEAASGHKAHAPRRLSDGSKLALKVLRALLRDEGAVVAGLDAPAETHAVSLDRWREKHQERFGGKGADADATGAERHAWKRALQQLQAASIVTVSGAWAWANDRRG